MRRLRSRVRQGRRFDRGIRQLDAAHDASVLYRPGLPARPFWNTLSATMDNQFPFDVFLSHSSKDKAVVRELATRLRADGVHVWFDEWVLKPGDSIYAKIEEGLEHSRVLVLCMSANAFGSDWAQLEAGTFRFRDPLNKERRFIPVRLDEAPLKGSLAQFLYINWLPEVRDHEYAALLEACKPVVPAPSTEVPFVPAAVSRLDYASKIQAYAFTRDKRRVLTGAKDNTVRLWDVATGECLCTLEGHTQDVLSVAWRTEPRLAASGGYDQTIRLWDLESKSCLNVIKTPHGSARSLVFSKDGKRLFIGTTTERLLVLDVESGRHMKDIEEGSVGSFCLAVTPDEQLVLSGCDDRRLRLWSAEARDYVNVLEGHTDNIRAVAWSADQQLALSGSEDCTVRLWDIASGRCLKVLEGHTRSVLAIAWTTDRRLALSGSDDMTVRLWDIEAGRCLRVFEGHAAGVIHLTFAADHGSMVSADQEGSLRVWNLAEFLREEHFVYPAATPSQVQYTNAKVLIVGDTSAGKTALTYRLARGEWKSSEDSTVGAWATQWRLDAASETQDADHEIWLWDFGGQADQRLVHQLYLDRTSLILLVFNADQEEVLPGLRDWQTALRRTLNDDIPRFLVAGRIDTGFKASRGKLLAFAKEQHFSYHETSAKSGEGCDELRDEMVRSIPWSTLEKRTSPHTFKVIKDEILKLRDEGEVLHTFKELRELLWRRLPNEPRFTDETLQTVIGLLDGPGIVKELDYGTYILLAPEWVNAYAQAVIRTLRSVKNELGALPLRSIAEGRLIYQSVGRDGTTVEMKRLPPADERVVLGEMERQLERRGLCLRQGDQLVFPSHCGRDRPEALVHPSIVLTYRVKGYLDDIYATLVVKLAGSDSFQLKELWRDAADFTTLVGDHHMGVKLVRESGSNGDINVYFGTGVTEQEQVIFANYIHAHLAAACEDTTRLRHYVCPRCGASKGNPDVLIKKLLAKKQEADTECDGCGERFLLWDALEKKFADAEVRRQVETLRADDLAKVDARRRWKLLVLDVGARITSANQKWYEVPQEDDNGIDLVVEFTDDDGNAIGKGLCLQLKAGNSHLTVRNDGVEVFEIKDSAVIHTWMNQRYPVMLVIGTFSEENKPPTKDRIEFADVRWMEVTSVVRRASKNGTKPIDRIEFAGERLDLSSIRRWRDTVVAND
jgi:small GTP-binding protein